MTLTTFGAIMRFASGVIGQSEITYQSMLEKAKNPALREALQSLLNESKKNHSLMEQSRREHVTEMILEPIDGLHPDDYQMDLRLPDSAGDVEIFKTALKMEEREKKFFQESSSRVPLPEVARMFRKIAQKKEKNIDQLRSLRLFPF